MPFQVSSAWKTTTTTTTAILYYVCITACNFGLWNDRIPSTTSLSHHVISSYLIARVCRRDYNETILRPGLNRETFHWEEAREGGWTSSWTIFPPYRFRIQSSGLRFFFCPPREEGTCHHHPLCLPLFLDDQFKYKSGNSIIEGCSSTEIRSWDRVFQQVDRGEVEVLSRCIVREKWCVRGCEIGFGEVHCIMQRVLIVSILLFCFFWRNFTNLWQSRLKIFHSISLIEEIFKM